jgi:hypothetical protein
MGAVRHPSHQRHLRRRRGGVGQVVASVVQQPLQGVGRPSVCTLDGDACVEGEALPGERPRGCELGTAPTGAPHGMAAHGRTKQSLRAMMIDSTACSHIRRASITVRPQHTHLRRVVRVGPACHPCPQRLQHTPGAALKPPRHTRGRRAARFVERCVRQEDVLGVPGENTQATHTERTHCKRPTRSLNSVQAGSTCAVTDTSLGTTAGCAAGRWTARSRSQADPPQRPTGCS